ncbi:hypothetical protein IDJ77_07055 [Mucilaginibacter sp. ZT4R22]|uniref:Uncharacterized protein n=1 Tax=Mucilaginibacter pankratovii TaxID=2772110 RepID=A0ABR7WMK8_9SPHI|nr:hypothetical protein [Mucilaginibacter pankratovii]MBD1363563.1 hypothetical protein [Mucilaginibacter pankratovii]
MKDKDEFLKEMETLQVPNADPSAQHQNSVKMAIMNANRSAALGAWLLAIPSYFLLCVFIYYYSHGQSNWFEAMFNVIISMDNTPWLDFMAPIVLIILPIVCIIINILAITHVQLKKAGHTRKYREFSFTIRIRWWNVLLIVLSKLIIAAFLAFAMTENISITKKSPDHEIKLVHP